MTPKQLAMLLLPLFIIPLTLYSVSLFGHNAANAIIGLFFVIGVAKFTKTKEEKRFAIILAIFAFVFETANLAIGAYKYVDVVFAPIWVGLGWGVVGLYLLRNSLVLKTITDKHTYVILSLLYLLLWLYNGTIFSEFIFFIFSLAAVYVLSISSKFSASFFGFTSILGIVIEFSGTSFGIWAYLSELGNVIPAPLAQLGMAYTSVVAFCLWISRVD